MSAVRTTNGTLVKAKHMDDRPLTEDEAKALAERCNAKADALGLEGRYEVTAK